VQWLELLTGIPLPWPPEQLEGEELPPPPEAGEHSEGSDSEGNNSDSGEPAS
jgi:hypothetical protein